MAGEDYATVFGAISRRWHRFIHCVSGVYSGHPAELTSLLVLSDYVRFYHMSTCT